MFYLESVVYLCLTGCLVLIKKITKTTNVQFSVNLMCYNICIILYYTRDIYYSVSTICQQSVSYCTDLNKHGRHALNILIPIVQ